MLITLARVIPDTRRSRGQSVTGKNKHGRRDRRGALQSSASMLFWTNLLLLDIDRHENKKRGGFLYHQIEDRIMIYYAGNDEDAEKS